MQFLMQIYYFKQLKVHQNCSLHLQMCVFIPSPIRLDSDYFGGAWNSTWCIKYLFFQRLFLIELKLHQKGTVDPAKHRFQHQIVQAGRNPLLNISLEWSVCHSTTSLDTVFLCCVNIVFLTALTCINMYQNVHTYMGNIDGACLLSMIKLRNFIQYI